jgi:threonine dehydrogenase-like Zn-dependent dehydrogenase
MTILQEKMKAVVTYGPHDYRYEEVIRPKAGKGELLIRVEACGICAGDIKAYKGGEVFWGSEGKPPYLEVPAIGGHELVGRIVEIGPESESKPDFKTGDREFRIGDRVTVEQIVQCGKCRYCETGRYSLCKKHDVFGFKYYLNGGFAEYAILPANALVYKVSDGMPAESAILIEPYACSYHAIERANITENDIVVISGAGPLGLGMITAARLKKPKTLIALDLQDGRLEMALKFGCDLAINPAKEDVYATIGDLTGGYVMEKSWIFWVSASAPSVLPRS